MNAATTFDYKKGDMKILLLVILGILGLTNRVHAQGSVYFNNRIAGSVDAPFVLPDGTPLEGTLYTAELALLVGGAATPLTPTTTFRTGIAAGYVVPTHVFVPGIPAGQAATLVLRVFESDAATYEAALATGAFHGQSNPVIVILGGTPPDGSRPLTTPNLVGLGWAPPNSEPVNWSLGGVRPPQGTVMSIQLVPEPTTLALAALGAALLLTRCARHRRP